MRNIFYLLVILISLLSIAGKIPEPPVMQDVQQRQYLEELYFNIHSPEITTTAPNGNIYGGKGKLILYNNSGTYSIWVNTDGSQTWQQL